MTGLTASCVLPSVPPRKSDRGRGMKRREVWNEHVKLLATLVNAIAIGILGVAVIGPLAQPENPFFGVWGDIDTKKLADLNLTLIETQWYEVLQWKAVALAFATHALAHLILRMQKDG